MVFFSRDLNARARAIRLASQRHKTVEQPIDDIAETAVNALQMLISEPGKPLPDSLFRPRLVVRGSTAPPVQA